MLKKFSFFTVLVFLLLLTACGDGKKQSQGEPIPIFIQMSQKDTTEVLDLTKQYLAYLTDGRIDDALAIVNGNLGGIIGKLFELLPINLAQAFANDIGQNMGTIREVISVVKAEKLANAPAPEPLVPEVTEPEKEGEADGTAPDNG